MQLVVLAVAYPTCCLRIVDIKRVMGCIWAVRWYNYSSSGIQIGAPSLVREVRAEFLNIFRKIFTYTSSVLRFTCNINWMDQMECISTWSYAVHTPRPRCVLLDDLYFCFSDFKFDFLSSDSSKFNSVWTTVLFRIFLTKWDPIWQVYFRFASATFYIIHFNILNVPFQHYHVKCWTMFAKCWTRFNEMLNPVFEMLNKSDKED